MDEGKIRQDWMPEHPTLYLKRKIYEQYGLYDIGCRCSADCEFMVRALDRREAYQGLKRNKIKGAAYEDTGYYP